MSWLGLVSAMLQAPGESTGGRIAAEAAEGGGPVPEERHHEGDTEEVDIVTHPGAVDIDDEFE